MIPFDQALARSLEYLVGRRVQSWVIAANYHLRAFDEVVWLIGDGRSGTTWVSDLINWEKRYREMFEPFHPRFVRRLGLGHHPYIRPDDSEHKLFPRASEVFSGKYREGFVDHANRSLLYRALLVKDVFANLFAGWAARRFPSVKIVLLVRNPFAVALSKWKLRHWRWMTDPREFLKQEPLVEDFLRPFEDLLQDVGDDFIERQVLIWAVLHYVPLLQFRPGQLHVMFYEDAVLNPQRELVRLFRYLELDSVDRMTAGALRVLSRPSRVALKHPNAAGEKWPIGQWKEQLSAEQIARGMRILARFGLDQLYDADSRPRGEMVPGSGEEDHRWPILRSFVPPTRGAFSPSAP